MAAHPGPEESEGGPARSAARIERLDRFPVGVVGVVHEVEAGSDDIERLQAMGVCPGRRVMLVRRGDPMILRVLGSRIGVSARLAERISVRSDE